jgi:hypothetical protein
VLQFLFTEINYGGRVTDDKDRRLMSNLITTFCGPSVLEEGYAFSPSGSYTIPSCETVAQVGDMHTNGLQAWSQLGGVASNTHSQGRPGCRALTTGLPASRWQSLVSCCCGSNLTTVLPACLSACTVL